MTGYVLAVLLGTSASESLSAAGNIFVGQTEAPLLVKVRPTSLYTIGRLIAPVRRVD
jgi:nucleoside permease NupC